VINATWKQALARCADPARARAGLERLTGTDAAAALQSADAEQAKVVCALFSGSQALGSLLAAQPQWLATVLQTDVLARPRRKQGLGRDVEAWLPAALEAQDYSGALRRLREFKQREMLRIAARDLARLADAVTTTEEISNLADVCLDAVQRICWRQLTQRLGTPHHQDARGHWQPTQFSVLGLGKLGGQELNYSSDVDVIFVYSEEGTVFKEPPRAGNTPGGTLTNHQFFTRLAEAFIAEVGRPAAEGILFRIDLRLRPEGNDGPLVRSLASYENYYAQWGQTWERLMLLKARCVAGDGSLAGEFLETVHPFRYPRALGERVLNEIATMKRRIEHEVVRAGEIERNVKLGRGGIREVEFVVQTLQLLQAGRQPFLQGSQTLPMLQKLVQYELLSEADARALAEAYVFLRDVEHRLQMENNLQTHTIPEDRAAQDRLARLMGFKSRVAFDQAHRRHRDQVRAIYERFIQVGAPEDADALPGAFKECEAEWKALLAAHSFRDVNHACKLVQTFIEGPGYVHVSPRTVELARQLLPKLLELCPRKESVSAEATRPASPAALPAADLATGTTLSDPDRVLARLDSFVQAYGARATMYELWTSHPSVFQMLVILFDRSEFLAETAISVPDLVDELALSGRLQRSKTAAETLADLRHGLRDEDQKLWLRRYHQAEFMRIGLRDILGLSEFGQNLVELSALADACLQYALEAVLRRHKLRRAPFELNYGSDLDILFVAPARARQVHKLQPLAAEVMDLLSASTEQGVVFQTDARLRPDGESGPLVCTLDAAENYYRQRARLWEIQTLSRTRFVAGDATTGRAFEELARRLSDFRKPVKRLAAWTADWRAEIARMRARIEKERTPAGKDHLAIKTGSGGLVDAEFIAQTLCLANGWHEPGTLAALQRAQREKVLPAKDAAQLIEHYTKLRRVEGILRRWSYAGETVLPDDPAPLYRVAVRCGFPDSESFLQTLGEWRRAIRSVYGRVFRDKPAPQGSGKKGTK
jgi:[glutamine synthetase] adenylyltransferase / [glutamine synthetase]-adenylyl-L-tyrosine phosphorylase